MKTLLGVMLYVFGLTPTATNPHLWKPARAPQTHTVQTAAKDRIGPAGMMASLRKDNSLRQYHYVFEGVATYEGKPSPNASVLVRVVSSRETVVQGATTDADGAYSVEISLEGSRYEPIDWSMEAFTPDSQKVELLGRRIVMREDAPVVVNVPVQLQAF
jgi:hypothetical protein